MSGVWVTDVADVLRAAGVKVVEERYTEGPYAGRPWSAVGYQGQGYRELRGIMWHHDSSPVGDSPGALWWCMYGAFGYPPAAAAWVDRKGVWHIYASGLTNHAGVGSYPKLGLYDNGNMYLYGIETDHTEGEEWPEDQVSSLRLGTAALLKAWGLDSSGLIGHREYAPNRKTDPHGLDMGRERRRVRKLMQTSDQGKIKSMLDRWFSLMR